MLVLSRKIGESIHIGDEIEIVAVRFERNAVRLAIKAPVDVKIYRGELYREIHARENAESSERSVKTQGAP